PTATSGAGVRAGAGAGCGAGGLTAFSTGTLELEAVGRVRTGGAVASTARTGIQPPRRVPFSSAGATVQYHPASSSRTSRSVPAATFVRTSLGALGGKNRTMVVGVTTRTHLGTCAVAGETMAPRIRTTQPANGRPYRPHDVASRVRCRRIRASD